MVKKPVVLGRPPLIRQTNAQILLRLLRDNGPCSKADLVRASGLSAPSVTNVVATLISTGLVDAVGEGDSTGGRPPDILRFKAEHSSVAGVEITRETLRFLLADLNGRELAHFHARVWQLAALAAAGGAGFGLYYPAAQGLLCRPCLPASGHRPTRSTGPVATPPPSAARRSADLIAGLAGPGWALAADAASFTAAAALRAGMRFQRQPPAHAPGMLRDFREGWREFTSHRWLWPIVTQFAVVTGVYAAAMSVLGPASALQPWRRPQLGAASPPPTPPAPSPEASS